MTIDSIDIETTIKNVEQMLREDKDISAAMVSAIKVLLLVVKLLAGRLGLNSRNSSKPPASDPHREKTRRATSDKPVGGQAGRTGTTLLPIDEPDEIHDIAIDQRRLPRGHYRDVGVERRQVFDIRIERHVTEYRAQILESDDGMRFVAEFPHGVTRPAQYGAAVRANAVYMSMFQLIPYERVQTHFDELFGLPLSSGTLCNFNHDAYERLALFEALAKKCLAQSVVIHADETSINVDGQRLWLHNASNSEWTLFHPHPKRGSDAMNAIGVLPAFRGTLVHDHWKPYYLYEHCTHALCNAHHLRELTFAFEEDGQRWADDLRTLLLAINTAVKTAGGSLSMPEARPWRNRYRQLLNEAEHECPAPEPQEGVRKRGRIKRSKSRNLLERLRDYEDDVLRFMENGSVPFTNNRGERDIRMTKVQQKISGCFRSMGGAQVFCRIRSYLSTCRKHGVGVGEALERLFRDEWPDFIQEKLDGMKEGAE